MKLFSILIGLSLSFGLAACSGGSSSPHSDPTPVPTPTPTPPAPPTPQFAYVLNAGDDNITQLSLNTAGDLIPLSVKTIPTGIFPKVMIMDKVHQTIYVANWGDNTISQYKVNGAGELSQIASSIPTGIFPQSLVLSVDARFLYATNSMDETISQYAIGSDGSLSLISLIPHADAPANMVFSSSGKFAYVVNMNTSEISQYNVLTDGSLQALTPASVPSAGCPSGPLGSANTANGQEVIYVLSCATDEVEVFSIGHQGELSSQQVVSTGALPVALKVTASNVYVVNLGDSTVSKFKIQPNGNLQDLGHSVPAGIQPENLNISRDGKFLYVVDFVSDNILQFDIGTEGLLTPSTQFPYPSGSSPTQIILN